MIGSLLQNRYRLDAELGRGGMGAVYRAHDTLLDREVAVKVLSSTGLGTQGRARLLREAQAAAKLNHPHIVSVHDAGESDSSPFIVMELVEGQSLRQYQPGTLSETLAIVSQICGALEHAHAHGIIHRDLKLENVLITFEPQPQPSPAAETTPAVKAKLMDFGLARSADTQRLTEESALIGTVFYVAPEIIQGQPASAQSDLYALGVMLYELTAGRPPFTGDNLMAVISQHLHAPPVPPSTFNPKISPALDALVIRLLGKQPDDRPASAAEVRQMLEHLDALAPVMPAATSALDRIVRGRLVARDVELAQAIAAWQQAASGEGQVLLVSGEPGIGKTRLVRELIVRVELERATALTGECYAEGGAPYAPIAQIIQAALDPTGLDPLRFASGVLRKDPPGLSPAVLADLLTLAPALRARFPDVRPNPPLEPQAEQQRIFESVVELCAALAAQAPLLLFVDDAHWADSGTLALLRHLARRTPRLKLKLLIVLTYREVELDEARALNQTLADLNRERLATRLKLTRLTRDQTQDLLAVMFAEEIAPEFLDGIYRETEGNPFFVEEVCKTLIEEGKLYRDGSRWGRPSMDQIQVPQSVRVAIQVRVGKLPDTAQETLRLASIFGREFDFDALKTMSELDEDTLVDALDAAERAQLIGEMRAPATGRVAARPRFAYAHALIPTTLREGMSGLRRQRLHRRAGLALERLYPNRLSELAAQLGRHFAEASEWDKAAGYLLQAGDRAREVLAYQEAIDHYRQALAILKEQGPLELARAAHTAMKLGLLHHTLFDFERSRQAYQEAFALWQRAGEAQVAVVLPPAPHALRQYWLDVETLDPALASNALSCQLIEQLFSGLVELSPELDVMPAMARTWEVLDGGRRYVFQLRGDAHWSDGAPVTARDFEYAWKRVLAPAMASPVAEPLLDIAGARAFHQGQAPTADHVGVRAPDDFTLAVELERPTGHLLYVLATTVAYPVPRHVVQAHGQAWSTAEHIVTNGPFRLESWQRGESLVLGRSSDYRGQFSGNLSRVELTLITRWTGDMLSKTYEAAEHDLVPLPDPDVIEQARQRHPHEYVSVPAAHTAIVGFDTTRPPFDDRRVRQAFVHAVDRQALADFVQRGSVSPATGGFVPPGMPGHSAGIGLAYDPDRARRLLAEAGYPGGRGFPAVDAWEGSSGGLQLVPRYLQTQWRDNLGISIAWETMEWADYDARLSAAPPHLFRMGWVADYPDPDSFLRVGLHQPYCRWRDDRFEQLLEAARRIPDQAERVKFHRAADRLLIEEAAILPLFHGRHDILIKPWVRRYPMSPLHTAYWKYVIIEPH